MIDLDKKLKILPDFPRTKHAPIEPNAQRDDLIANADEFWEVVSDKNHKVFISEKIDAANVGITIYEDQPLIRNRNKILSKNYDGGKTPAKLQFSPIWTWYYSNKDKFEVLGDALGYMPCVYGEWMYARHTIKYDQLPDYFIAFDLYNPEECVYYTSDVFITHLKMCGLHIVPQLSIEGKITEDKLIKLRDGKSEFSNENKEGIYIKVCDENKVLYRFKMVRNGFVQGEHWNKRGTLEKNEIIKVKK